MFTNKNIHTIPQQLKSILLKEKNPKKFGKNLNPPLEKKKFYYEDKNIMIFIIIFKKKRVWNEYK